MTDRHQHAAVADLERLIIEPEGERLEFKEARSGFHFDKLAKYCTAISNEGGGSIVLGVTDRRPRRIVGTHAFEEPGRTVAGLTDRLRIKIEWIEVQHPDGRVLIFSVPARPLGLPVQYEGIYWARAGDELRPMATQELQRAFDEAGPDFSAELHPSATLGDLDPGLIDRFRAMWRKKSGNKDLDRLAAPLLLNDAELMTDGKVTIAALVLLGTRDALGRYLGQAEVVFEYLRRSRFRTNSESNIVLAFSASWINCGRSSTFETKFCITRTGSSLATSRHLMRRWLVKPS